MKLKSDKRDADFWVKNEDDNTVTCLLSPRNCKLKEGQVGFCGVRGNVDNKLVTFNYGKSVEATIENVESEAVYHFHPGARILSLGNIGCMMACSFCQNWSTSQVKHLNIANIKTYTPEGVIKMALENNINIISWTYNDPVVWQEFVVETSKLARKNGIKTLYKSALYIEPEPLSELIKCIDIFSVSLKSMDADMYVKITKGRLQPVLDGIKQIHKSGLHLEISQLIVTGLNDNDEDATKTSKWMVENLGPNIPLHFVAYHPAFRYKEPRTPLDKLMRAREIALNEGIKYCYIGNKYHEDVSNTRCLECDNLLIQRFGLAVQNVGMDENNCCTKCQTPSPIVGDVFTPDSYKEIEVKAEYEYEWKDGINSIHVLCPNKSSDIQFNIQRFPTNTMSFEALNDNIERLIISKSTDEESSIKFWVDTEDKIIILPILDRAHFPVVNDSKNQDKYLN